MTWKECERLCVSHQDFETVYVDILITKLTDVMDGASHPFHDWLLGLTDDFQIRYSSSFIPQAIITHSCN